MKHQKMEIQSTQIDGLKSEELTKNETDLIHELYFLKLKIEYATGNPLTREVSEYKAPSVPN